MDNRIKELWTDALKSKKYKQCSGKLKQANTYCCLGVLTELYLKEHPNDSETKRYLNMEGMVLNKQVKEWAGLEESGAIDHPQYSSLADMNDDGRSFEDIADNIGRLL